jgi:hypothetical protein
MSLLDRSWKVLTGIGGAVQAPLGYVKDLATAPFVDDEELDGFLNVVAGRAADRGFQALTNLIGPDEGLGAAIGGLPEPVRDVGRGVVNTLETVGREVIREPISTALTAASLGQAGEGGIFSAESWKKAYGIAQDRSWGQSLALAILTDDLKDTAEVNRAKATDAYRIISGTADAIGRVMLDPDILIAKAGTAAKTAAWIKPLTSAQKVKAAGFNTRVTAVLDDIHDSRLSAAQIRDRYFAKHDHGGPISDVLARASGDREELQLAFRSLIGDTDALATLGTRRADLAGELSRLTGPQELAARLERAGFELPRALKDEIEVQKITEARQRYTSELDRLDRILGVQSDGTTVVPRTAGAIRDLSFASPISRLVQDSALSVPVHAIQRLGRMRPGPFINFEDVASDVTLTRMLKRSTLDDDTVDGLRTAYLEQGSAHGRRQVFDQAVDRIVGDLGERAGLDGDDLQELVSRARFARGKQATEVSRSRSFDAQGRGVFEVVDDDGVIHRTAVPLWMTQESNFSVVPDLDLMRKASDRIANHEARYSLLPDWVPGRTVTAKTALGSPSRELVPEFLDAFHRVWKPGVLFRPAWPIRVGADEQLRIAAKIGALTQGGELVRSAKNWTVDAIDAAPSVLRGEKSWAEAKDRFGLRWFEVNGYRMQDARGTPADGRNLHEALVAQTSNLNARLFGAEADELSKMRKATADHRTFAPDDAEYGSRWEHVLNKQVAQDAVGRRLLAGESVEDVATWLRTDEAGQAYMKQDPLWRTAESRGLTLEEILEWRAGQVEDLTLGHRQLADAAIEGRASVDDLQAVEPDVGRWMPVHGQVVADAFGGSAWSRLRNDLVSKTYKALSGLPSTVLARNRFFDQMYRKEVDRLMRLSEDVEMSDDALRLVERQARDFSLAQVKRWLFDVSEESDLAHMLRFVSPFFMAQQEVLTRWAGLAAENPAFILQMRKVWNSPEKAGIIVDENGSRIDANGNATVVATGESTEAGEDRFVVLPIPEWAEDIPGAQALSRARFNKESLNVALQLNSGIGTGPIVQVPVNEIVKDRPDLASSLKFALPYGTSQDTLDLMLPATVKRMRTQAQEEGSDEYRNAAIRIYYDMVTDYNLGKRDTKPTWTEAKEASDAFWSMRTVASFVSPAAPWFTSPYQMQIEAYRNAQDLYRAAEEPGEENLSLAGAAGRPRTPDEWFLDKFGREFFALTQSVSDSVDGVPPTVEGFVARKEHQELIESLQVPALGGLVVGAEGAGEFSRDVYEHQKVTPIREGSDTTQREGMTIEEAMAAPDVRMGWMKFSRFMDLLDAEVVQRGLPNLQVSEAQDLAALKRAYVEKLAEQFPAWYREFADPDPLAAKDKIADLRAIAADDTLAKRPDIRGLQQYLRIRDVMARELATRQAAGGASTLQARSNQDLAHLWDTLVMKLKTDAGYGLAFSDLHSRWLANDRPAASDVAAVAA